MESYPTIDRRARIAALALLAALLGYAAFVEFRVATARKRRIDLDVVLRAAWAVRTGTSPYAVTNERGWHYNLPPLLAILLTPLAEPPPEQARPGAVSILAALAAWNVLGLIALAAGVHSLANALTPASSGAWRPGGWRWWAVRAGPVAACLPAIGITLNRGQVNLFLAALLCATASAAIRGRSYRAGLWLAGAICLKIIPAYLLIQPLWRRDRRWLAGTLVGLAVALGAIPAVVFGPARAVECYEDLARSVLLPGLSLGGDQTRAVELIDLHASNSQSFQVLFHNLLHWNESPRPSQSSPGLRSAHWLLVAALTLATLRVGGRGTDTPIQMVIRFGALAVLMVAASPASHDHYFCVNLPLVVGLVAAVASEGSGAGGRALAVLLIAYITACALPMVPDLRTLRDIRLPLLGSLSLWLAGVLVLARLGNRPSIPENEVFLQDRLRSVNLQT